MMENKLFRWISFAVTVILAIVAICVGTISGFLCFAAAAFILIPVNHLFEKLDGELDPKYRKRATAITAGIFLICGLLAFTTAGNSSDGQTDKETVTTTTTAITTTIERTTEPTTTTTKEMTTTTTTTTTTTITTTEATTTTTVTTTAAPVIETEPEIIETETVVKAPQTIHFILNLESGCLHASSTCSAAEAILPENRSEIDISEDSLGDYAGQYWACGKCAKRYSSQLPKP